MKKTLICLSLFSALVLTGCNDGNDGTNGKDGSNGTAGANGSNGTNGQNGFSSLVQQEVLAFGHDQCWLGGLSIQSGLDKNNNTKLDADEISQTTVQCKTNPLFATTGVRPAFVSMNHIAPVLDDVTKNRYIDIRQGGFGSDITAHPTIKNRFYAVTDRGPNADLQTADAPTGKRFPDPTYVPRIGEFEVTEHGVFKVREILLKDRNGDTITGLPNPAGLGYTNEGAFGPDGKPLVIDPSKPFDKITNPYKTDAYGLDAEGLVAMPDGSFWVSDEYGPHIIHFDANGKEIDRINAFAQDNRRVGGYILPAEFGKRRPNRGMEGLTITPDGKTLVGIMQSTLSNPAGAANKSNLTRIVTINLETKKVSQYLYQQGDAAENISGQEFSNSAIVALSATSFLVLERDGAFYRDNPKAIKRVYKIDLRSGTDLESLKDANQLKQDDTLGLTLANQTLEQIIVANGADQAFKKGWEVLANAGIKPVSKTQVLDMVKEVKYPHDKMEGLWLINNSTLGVMNDDDFSLWVNPNTFALQQKYLDKELRNIDGNTLYVINNLDLKPIP